MWFTAPHFWNAYWSLFHKTVVLDSKKKIVATFLRKNDRVGNQILQDWLSSVPLIVIIVYDADGNAVVLVIIFPPPLFA